MGNDGGSIPKRRELVKEAARNPTAAELKETIQEQQDHLWNVDPLSQRPLARPVVSDSLGRLFNKDAIIEFLLPSDDDDLTRRLEQDAILQGTVKNLKDVVEVLFEIEEMEIGDAKGRRDASARIEKWVCPITRQALGPGSKAVYLVPCGHAFSGAAVKEISGEQCLQCNEPYVSNDVIPILPTLETDIARLALRTCTLRDKGLTHSLKKAASGGKKRKKNTADAPLELLDANDSRVSSIRESHDSRAPSKGSTPQPHSGASTPRLTTGIKNAATASLTAKVLEEQEERNKRRKIDKNENLNSLFSSNSGSSAARKGRDIDFMNRGFAIASKR